MTRKASGVSASAPEIPASASSSPKTEATEAATIPRGAIQERKARSRVGRSERNVETSTATGRTTSISTSTKTRVPERRYGGELFQAEPGGEHDKKDCQETGL